jgi:hypothetical protein
LEALVATGDLDRGGVLTDAFEVATVRTRRPWARLSRRAGTGAAARGPWAP